METIPVIELFLAVGAAFLDKAGSKLPAEVLNAVQSALAALTAHKDDLLTKANFEAQRG